MRVEFAVRDAFRTLGGAVQGGIIAAYADACMTLAARSVLAPRDTASTACLAVRFLAPVGDGPVIGLGLVVKQGRSVLFLEASLRDRRGRECAHATSVVSIRCRGR